MTEQIREQLTLLLMAAYTGIAMAFAYDLIRIIRNIKQCKTVTVWIQDICYWIFFGYVVYALLLKYNYGGIRGYAFLGIVIGMAIYFMTVSRIFVKYVSLIIVKIMNTLLKALKFVLKPIRLICNWLNAKYRKRVIVWRKQREEKQQRRKEKRRQRALAKEADRKERTTTES